MRSAINQIGSFLSKQANTTPSAPKVAPVKPTVALGNIIPQPPKAKQVIANPEEDEDDESDDEEDEEDEFGFNTN